MFEKFFEIGSLVKRASEFGGKIQEMNEKLRELRIEGTAGGGLVTVGVNGLQEAVSCRIDPSLLQQPDAELLEELIVAAINDAIDLSREQQTESMKALTSGLDVGNLSEMINKIGKP